MSNCLLKYLHHHYDSIESLTSLWSMEFDDELVESPEDGHLMFTLYSVTD